LWSEGNRIALWNTNSDQLSPLSTEGVGGDCNLVFSGDGERVAVAGRAGIIQLHEASSGELLATWPAHEGLISYLCFSPDGRNLASHGQDDLGVRIWDTHTHKLRQEWKSRRILFSLCFSPDGRDLAYFDADADQIATLDVATGQERVRLNTSEGQIHSLAYSPDGRLIVAGGFNGILRFFNLAARRCVATYAAHSGDIGLLRFSPDGRRLATSARDGRVRLWELPTAPMSQCWRRRARMKA
jgi:WD40 repeat protein